MSYRINKTFKKIHLRPAQQIALSFLLLIVVGTFLLSLPIAQSSRDVSFIDNLFTATSAVCVTGLTVRVPLETYTLFGQSVILLLMQLGGLGLMTIIAIILMALGGRLGHAEKLVMKEAMPRSTLNEIGTFIGFIVMYTLLFEFVGAVFLSIRFIPQFGIAQGIFKAIFISVSAFCNAGFDVLGSTSLVAYQNDVLVNVVVMALIIMGGLGFTVWFDLTKSANSILKHRNEAKRIITHLQVHIKLVFHVTLILLVTGSVFIFISEFNNLATIGHLPLHQKILVSMFQSTTLRTAGFSTINIGAMRPVSLVVMMIFMFIGGSPGGTAGGIKTTTFALVLMMVFTELANKERIVLFKRSIHPDIFRRALAITISAFTIVTIGFMALLVSERADFLTSMFEVFSAFGTVGLSMGLTGTLTNTGKIVIIILMFIGRIGPVALAYSLRSNRTRRLSDKIEYPNGQVIVG